MLSYWKYALVKIIQKEYVGIVAKKVRVCGLPSSCKPPESAPPWAIKKNSEGKCEHFIIVTLLIIELLNYCF